MISGETSSKRRWVFVFVVATRLVCKAICANSTEKGHFCLSFLDWIIIYVKAGFGVFTVEESRISSVETIRFYWLKCRSSFRFSVLEKTHLLLSLKICCPRTNWTFASRCICFFFVFCCFCVLLYRKRYFVNKRLRFTLIAWPSRSSHFSPLQLLLQQYMSPLDSLIVSYLDVVVFFTKSTLKTDKMVIFVQTAIFQKSWWLMVKIFGRSS